jgi:adenylate cyclase
VVVERRLAAILAADVVGYSRLIGVDEAGTLTALRGLLKEVVEPAIKRHRGRVAKLMGDGLLAEFASVVDAVAAAVEIQEAAPKRSEDLAEDQRIALRVGVNIGDIAVEGGDLFGDGVNVASRLQEVADPNGVAISDGAYRELSGRLDAPFEDAGEKALKNIKQPVRVWTWAPLNGVDGENASDAPFALSDKPSIAVLPFDNMSGDAEQEYFADGVTEDIITALSRFRQLVVLARNTSFTYKGQSVDVKSVAQELNVRYVLEGSVRKVGNRVRVTAQLIAGASGNHLWADRFDRDLEDIFAVQDEITQVVAGAIEPEITKAEFERVRRTPPSSLDAWSMYQHGMHHFHLFTRDGDEEARRYFRAAIALDPNFSSPHTSIARSYSRGVVTDLPEDMEERYRLSMESAQKAVLLDRDDAYAYVGMGFAQHRTNPEAAVDAFEEALSINPNLAIAHFGMSVALVSARQPDRAISHLQIAFRLSPRDPLTDAYHRVMATAFFLKGEYDLVIEWSSKARTIKTLYGRTGAVRVAAFAHLGRDSDMERESARLLEAVPHFSISLALNASPELGDPYAEGLRKAGFKD